MAKLTEQELLAKITRTQNDIEKHKKAGKDSPNLSNRLNLLNGQLKTLRGEELTPEEKAARQSADQETMDSVLGEGVFETTESMLAAAGGEEAFRKVDEARPKEIQDVLDRLARDMEPTEADLEIIQRYKDRLGRTPEDEALLAALKKDVERTPEEQAALDLVKGKANRSPEQQAALDKLQQEGIRKGETADLIARYKTQADEGLGAKEYQAEREQMQKGMDSELRTQQAGLAKAQARGKVYGAAAAAQNQNVARADAERRGDIEQQLFLESAALKRSGLDKMTALTRDAQEFERQGMTAYQAALASQEKYEGEMATEYGRLVDAQLGRRIASQGELARTQAGIQAGEQGRLQDYGNEIQRQQERRQGATETWGGAVASAVAADRAREEYNINQDKARTGTFLGTATGLAGLQAQKDYSKSIADIAGKAIGAAGGSTGSTTSGGGGGSSSGGSAGSSGGGGGNTGGREASTPTDWSTLSDQELQAKLQGNQAEVEQRGGADKAPGYARRVQEIQDEINRRKDKGGGATYSTTAAAPAATEPAPQAPAVTQTPNADPKAAQRADLIAKINYNTQEMNKRGGKAKAPIFWKRVQDFTAQLNAL